MSYTYEYENEEIDSLMREFGIAEDTSFAVDVESPITLQSVTKYKRNVKGKPGKPATRCTVPGMKTVKRKRKVTQTKVVQTKSEAEMIEDYMRGRARN